MEGCANQKPPSGDDGCGGELSNWYKTLRKAEIWAAARPVQQDAKPPPKKKQLALHDLPKECTTVLNAGGGAPDIAEDGTVPAALLLPESKDAGPPAPHLDAAGLEALKAEMSGKPKPTTESASASGSVPLPDRKPH
jgi:penicillin-insensitive murein endopeptidase